MVKLRDCWCTGVHVQGFSSPHLLHAPDRRVQLAWGSTCGTAAPRLIRCTRALCSGDARDAHVSPLHRPIRLWAAAIRACACPPVTARSCLKARPLVQLLGGCHVREDLWTGPAGLADGLRAHHGRPRMCGASLGG